MNMKNTSDICKWFLGIIFAIFAICVLKICVFSDYIAEYITAKALPLSIVSVAISILFFAVVYENKK